MYADINGLKMFYEIRGTSDPAKGYAEAIPHAGQPYES